jgi:hypothetical protein
LPWGGQVLANALDVPLGNLHPLAVEHLLGFRTLRAFHMVSQINGQFIVHIPGVERTYPALPHYLFSIEDGRLHYDARVKHNNPLEQEE